MARFKHTLSFVSLALLAGCGKPASTVTKSTVNVTGCPAENLATFNYQKSAKTWQAACGEHFFDCTAGRGKDSCTQTPPQNVDPELKARAQLLFQVPRSRRDFFVRTNIVEGDWQTFARNVAVVAALNDERAKQVDDPRTVFTGFSPAFNQQLAQCVGLSKVAEVSVEGNGQLGTSRGGARCVESLLGSPDLAPLKQYVGMKFILAANVRDIKVAQRTPDGGSIVPDSPADLERKRLEEEAAKAKAEQERQIAIVTSIYDWLDAAQQALTTCTGLKEIPLDVVIDEQGVTTVTPQGKLNTKNKASCVKAAMGEKTFEGGARTLSYTVGAPRPDPAAAPAPAPAAAPAPAGTPPASGAPTAAPAAPATAPPPPPPPPPPAAAPAPAAPAPAPAAPTAAPITGTAPAAPK